MKIITILLLKLILVQATKDFKVIQSGLNQYVINVKGSTKPVPILCLYDSQSVALEAAFWTAEDILDEPKNCATTSISSKSSGLSKTWENRTTDVLHTCSNGKCTLPAG